MAARLRGGAGPVDRADGDGAKSTHFMRESRMRTSQIDEMDFEQLWRLYEELSRVLAIKIVAERHELEKKLAQLVGPETGLVFAEEAPSHPVRKYPKVAPKYRNPLAPEETWTGRGKRPKWLVKALEGGARLETFKIGSEPES